MDSNYWFEKKQKQFLKNIDTFYYSVYLKNDMTSTSTSNSVYKLRCFLEKLKNCTDIQDISFKEHHLIYIPGRFSVYAYRFSCPDFFDFFVASSVNTNDTPFAIMQLRSRVLWQDGVYSAVYESMDFIQAFCGEFGLVIREVRENRCDFACHSNYLSDPERFFEVKHFVKMWVGKAGRNGKEHTKEILTHNTVYDDDEIETDYVAIGKRGGNVFIRIYLKSKEVIQEGYKGFFLKLWQLSGLISRYDLYCLEEAYKRKSWAYVDYARLNWALEDDDELSEDIKKIIYDLLNDDKVDINKIHAAAKKYTRPVTKIFNVEFQVMRDMSKTFKLVEKNEGVTARVYDYLDNYSLIYEYLTRVTLRLVKIDNTDSNKARRENNSFWDRLRAAKTVDFKKKNKNVKLLRKYNSNVSLEMRKKRAVNALSCFGFAINNNPESSIYDDAANLLSILNDNDLDYIDKHKSKLAATTREVIPDEQKRFRSIYFLYDPDQDKFY